MQINIEDLEIAANGGDRRRLGEAIPSDVTELHEGAQAIQTQVSNRTPNAQCAERTRQHRKVMVPF
jgi:hypothetical protein